MHGRVQHFFACLPYVDPYVTLLSSVIGCESDSDYDRTVPVPPIVRETALFIREVLEKFAFRGRSLWPPVPSTLHEAFLAGATEPTSVVVLTWDAALHGWGLVLHWWDNRNGKVIIGSLPNSDEMQQQADGRLSAGLSPSRLPTRKSNY